MAAGPGRWPPGCSDSGSGRGKLAQFSSPLTRDAGSPPVPSSDVLRPLETREVGSVVELRVSRAWGLGEGVSNWMSRAGTQ